MVIDDELRENIRNEVERQIEQWDDDNWQYDQVKELVFEFRKEKHEFDEFNSFINKRLIDIEAMIHNHAIGVQNVYTQMQEIRDFFAITKMDTEMLEKIARIKEIIE